MSMNKFKRESLALPPDGSIFTKDPSMVGLKNVNMGTNAVNKGLKKHPIDEARRGLGMMKPDEKIKTDTNDVKKTLGISEGTLSFETVALIEQLLLKSNALIEEFNRDVNVDTVSTGAGGAAGEGKGVQSTNYTASLNRYSSAVNHKMDDERASDRVSGNQASRVEPGTGTLIKAHSVTAANAKAQGANNNAQTQERLAQQAQEGQ